jgi:uncharacterized protein YdbL (DUF1318 family)
MRIKEETRMKTKYGYLALLAMSLSVFVSCITVNIYFPEATVKKAADEIVDEVRKREETNKGKQESEKMETAFSGPASFSLVPSAYAQQETTVSTPTIRALKQSLKDREPALTAFFNNGSLGEANNGLVEIRDESSLNLKDKATLRNLVNDENSDRQKLYAEVAKALNIDPSQIGRIQKIFAESWIKNSAPGWWVQKESGEWVKKQ